MPIWFNPETYRTQMFETQQQKYCYIQDDTTQTHIAPDLGQGVPLVSHNKPKNIHVYLFTALTLCI